MSTVDCSDYRNSSGTCTSNRIIYVTYRPALLTNANCYDFKFNLGPRKLFHGQWIDGWTFRRNQFQAFTQLAIHGERPMRPIYCLPRVATARAIRQPCWSHNRRDSITSKHRQKV